MKIKKLEVHGFKSFVDKTNLVFPKGVTSIVGPNGCGKSNVVDAIRWVLGEQNARHLRGKVMEDIIFNGSESRKPIGMAEAVLTLSNEQGLAPASYVNFSEIEVMRRLYRSGESEYYINKVQCRLKDIVDLFTDTGIGTRAYSIIEQGQVGWLVNAKPDERRVLFEEAAGINKYKHRKDAALRRLDAAKQNLTRVNDIIGEVKRQMNSLNRQAKKAERYKAMREELKGFEVFIASEEFNTLGRKKLECAARLDQIKDKNSELTASILREESGLEEVRTRFLREENILKDIKQRKFEINNKLQEREKELEFLRLKIEELKRNEERFKYEIEELRVHRDAVTYEIKGLNDLQQELTGLVSEEETRLANEEAELKSITAELSQKDADARARKSEHINLIARVSQIKNNIAVCLKDEDRMNLALGRHAREREELDNSISRLTGSIDTLKTRILEAAESRQNIEKSHELTQEQLKAQRERLSQKNNDLNKLRQDLTHANSRRRTLKELEDRLDGFHDGVRAIMLNQKADQGLNGRIHGLVADVIETNAEHEKAVEAVLGERLQYVIVESQAEGVEAVEYLKTQAKGRGSFLPLKDSRAKGHAPSAHAAYPDTEELINHVRVKDGFSPIADYLLGDVLLVKNLNAAIDIWRLNGNDRTFVTHDGEIVDCQGVITGGNSSSSDAGILQKKREIKELAVLVSNLDGLIREAEDGIRILRQEIDINQKNLDSLRESGHSKRLELANIEGELKREDSELNRLRQRLGVIEHEAVMAKDELTAVSSKKAQLSLERESSEAELRQVEDTVQAITDSAASLNKRKEELSSVVTGIKVRLASSRERLDSVTGQIRDKGKMLLDIENRIIRRQSDLENGAAEIHAFGEKRENIKGDVEGILKTINDVSREETGQEEIIGQTTQEINRFENAISSIRKEIAGLQEEVNAINLTLKETELNMGHIVEKMAERYGVSIESHIAPEEIKSMERGALTARAGELKAQLADMGEVSLGAIEEYKELETRHQFLLDQQTDLNQAVDTLNKAINRINRTTRDMFRETFDAINLKFQEVFPKFFRGGKAELRLVDEGDLLESGIEIAAQPPGKRLQSISLLSGGEKALTATSLIFSIFLIKPSPFCLLDEVDAPLDDANIDRFNGFLKEMSVNSQFILITHNKKTMEIADTLFGVTMQEPGVSKIVSVQLN